MLGASATKEYPKRKSPKEGSIYTYTSVYVCIICVHVCVCAHVCVCVSPCLYFMCEYTYIYMYIYVTMLVKLPR